MQFVFTRTGLVCNVKEGTTKVLGFANKACAIASLASGNAGDVGFAAYACHSHPNLGDFQSSYDLGFRL